MDKPTLLIVQPYLTKYRLPVFKELNQNFEVAIIATQSSDYGSDIYDKDMAINTVSEFSLSNKLFWQASLLKNILLKKYDVLFITANPRYISTLLTLIFAKIRGVKVLLHGQGLYNKKSISFSNKLIYQFFNLFSDRYIAYTNFSKESLFSLPIYKKTVVAENSIVNEFPVEKDEDSKNGVLFLGRLREGSEIEMLIDACLAINSRKVRGVDPIVLYIIGGGRELIQLKEKYSKDPCINFCGEIYDSKSISDISKNCFLGCYPGDAGLSVLHYMSLSLPVVVHSDIHMHMGPEPSYVEPGLNGSHFDRKNKDSLIQSIIEMKVNKTTLRKMQKNAFYTYKSIVNPPLASRFEKIITDVLKK
ncbi:glycosyltransferase [Alteromonas oceani]|uniref:Glycosyltransferase n=1 Tax=Alteromonas oceani TaxID=2071609 RepID=A0ABV7JQI7_9ALTE|nr:glycosyltransferase [Alteromonas oceani]